MHISKKNRLKPSYLILFIFLSASILFSESLAQQKTESSTKIETTQTVKMGSRKNYKTVAEQREIIQNHLKCIETKEKYLKSNDSLNQNAIEAGWFKEMEAIRNSLTRELEQLNNK